MKTIADLEAKKGYRFLKVIYIIIAVIVLVFMIINISRNNRYMMGMRFLDYTQEQTEWLGTRVKLIYPIYNNVSNYQLGQRVLDRVPEYKDLLKIVKMPPREVLEGWATVPKGFVLDIPQGFVGDISTISTKDSSKFTEQMNIKSSIEKEQAQKKIKYRLYTIGYSLLYFIVILVITEILKRIIYYIFLGKVIPKRQ